MDADDEQDDLIGNDETPRRERAAARLDQIADLTKLALANARIDIGILFFLVPRSGNANTILIVGTPGDPTEELWRTVTEAQPSPHFG
jgi:hypothetical protein